MTNFAPEGQGGSVVSLQQLSAHKIDAKDKIEREPLGSKLAGKPLHTFEQQKLQPSYATKCRSIPSIEISFARNQLQDIASHHPYCAINLLGIQSIKSISN